MNLRLLIGCIIALGLNSCGDKSKSKSGGDDTPQGITGGTSGGGGGSSSSLEVGTGPTFSAITSSGFTVSWTAATSAITDAAKLEYQLVSASASSDLITVSQATAVTDTGILLPWTANKLSHTVTGLSASLTLAVAVLVRDEAGNVSLYSPQTVTTLVKGAPVVGTALTFSDVAQTSFKVSWGAATDPEGLALSYKVVYAQTAAAIDTIEKASAITGTATNWLSTTSATLSGLTLGTSYAVTVIAKNSAGLQALYTPVTRATLPKRLFVTQAKMQPNFMGPAAADTYCNADPAKPSGTSTYKALISSSLRRACVSNKCTVLGASEHVDWVFQPNTPYGRPDGTLVGITDSLSLLPDPLLSTLSTERVAVWGGINSSWTTDALHNCVDYTSNASDQSNYGLAVFPNYLAASGWMGASNTPCNSTASLLCVEQ